jgi:hypothetical protein
MPFTARIGAVYEFDRIRVNEEIGNQIPTRSAMLGRIQRGGDVYTLMPGDAKSLAKDAYHNRPADRDIAHQPGYYPHYHPGRDHDFGHIFFGQRGG